VRRHADPRGYSLDAAHCYRSAWKSDSRACLGGIRRDCSDADEMVAVQEMFIHPHFNDDNNHNVIMLVRLATHTAAPPWNRGRRIPRFPMSTTMTSWRLALAGPCRLRSCHRLSPTCCWKWPSPHTIRPRVRRSIRPLRKKILSFARRTTGGGGGGGGGGAICRGNS